MITVNTRRLIEAIEEADVFSLPEMNEGTEYLYTNLYGRLSRDEDVSLSGLDFNAFALDDVDTIRDLYSGVLERNEDQSEGIARSLWGLMPITTAAAFV